VDYADVQRGVGGDETANVFKCGVVRILNSEHDLEPGIILRGVGDERFVKTGIAAANGLED
jgi:hypothetical protein